MKPPKVGKVSALKFLIDYIMRVESTEQKLIYGMNCNPDYAYEEMLLTKHQWNKIDGRQYCHFIQSFSPNDAVTPELANELGQRLINEFDQFQGFEIVMATHINKNHIHNHFAINSVNSQTGLKWEQKARDLYLLKERCNELCRQHQLSQIQLRGNEEKQRAKQNQSYGEWKHRKTRDSWKAELENHIKDCLSYCTNKPQFYHAMNERGVDVKWTKERAAVTFTIDGIKCRNTKLSNPKFFSKENMQAILDSNNDNMDLLNDSQDLFLEASADFMQWYSEQEDDLEID